MPRQHKMNHNILWPHGSKVKLAAEVGISIQFLSNILCRLVRAPKSKAKLLEEKSMELFGFSIPASDWLDPLGSDNPYMGERKPWQKNK